ncbi:uncharacterized protein LOC134705676 [Mytilus trossulus]|uniref:uncharacterized protein LOC134705676 n=1 Tax=Mytilus trossulus TaxID=6551 RepID=UPI00300499D7
MKIIRQLFLFLVFLWTTKAFSHLTPIPTEHFLLHETLDYLGNYHVYWKFNKTHITFEVHVKTRGYVGFGISPNGKMYPSDVVVGWVKDGVPHLSDMHTVGHVQPVNDTSQDWTLLHGEENNFGTVLKFERPLTTCDNNDTDIVDATMRIIFSYHPDDPTNDNHMPWHGATRRGAKSMMLLSTSKQYKLPNDSQTKDLVHHQFNVPTKRTTYQCRVYSLDDITTKHHMIKFEAVIQKDHEPFVHHMNVYKCHNYPRKYIGTNFECYTSPLDMMPCGHVVAGWAVGSGPFNFPPNVGLPLGENENEYAYIIEIHYNNPGAVTGLVDSSGMKFTYTSHLRQHDAGILTVGMYENKQQIIPPHYSDFKIQSVCSKECISKALTDASLDEIKLFAVWQHAHLLARGITTRHLRNDVELEPIAEDEHYDFDYQETRLFRKEIPMRKGDSIRVECTYDSTLRKNITYGGYSTVDEMCFSFVYYYPRTSLFMTIQSLLYDTIPRNTSLLSYTWKNPSSLDDLVNLVKSYDWTDDSVRSKFQQDVLNSTMRSRCYWLQPPYIACLRDMTITSHLLLFLNCIFIANAIQQLAPVPLEHFLLHEILDHLGNFHVYWKFNQTHITFEVHVRTRGYVGFGFSPNGKMYPSDVVVGWVKDGVPHFSDYHTVGHLQPVKDLSQDWTLLHGEENNFGTVLKFERPLSTCDENDTNIVDDTMRIIFSYHPDDPTDDNHMPWHGATRRGAKSVLLLSTSKQYKLPDDSQTKDLVHHQFHIPSKRTTYQCTVYSLEDITTKHHTIKFEAVIQKNHEPFVHHMNVYKCHNYPRKYIGRNFECYAVPLDMMPCGNVVAGWAVGSGPFHFPPNVGLPIGENENEYAYIIEIHYNNPGAVTDIVDSSGMRFTYTSHLRQYDAGLLTVGMRENRQHIIPPHYNEFKVQIEATKECISKGLTDASIDEIKLFAVWQHAHLLGKGITTRHLRNDVELEPIAEDQHYDFDYQETRLFRKEVPVKKGDSIRVECTYDSSLRKNITYGGLSTENEMCFSFIYYYPRFPLYMTSQSLIYDTIPGHSSLLSFSWDDQSSLDEMVNLVETYDWTDDSVRRRFQQDVLDSTLHSTCSWKQSPVVC